MDDPLAVRISSQRVRKQDGADGALHFIPRSAVQTTSRGPMRRASSAPSSQARVT
jgi:hypothetical protein